MDRLAAAKSRWGWYSLTLFAIMFPDIHAAAGEGSTAMSHRILVTEEYRDEVRAAINARNRLFEQNIVSGDADKLIDDYFVPDEWMPIGLAPHRPPVRGRDAIKADFARMGEGLSGLKIESLEVEVSQDMASEIGRVYLTDKQGATRVGRYTVLWLKTDKGWLAKMDFFAPDAWTD
jgi:ketosteroid isomerase-like protein